MITAGLAVTLRKLKEDGEAGRETFHIVGPFILHSNQQVSQAMERLFRGMLA